MADYQKENEKMKQITINGDDYGLNERNTRAIAEAFEKGLITDTTMLANGEYFDEAIALAEKSRLIDNIGVHLNLTWGEPLTEDIKRCERFVTDGRFTKQYDRTKKLTDAEKDAIYKELTAQVRKIKDAGVVINHADSHHHIHTGVFVAPIAARVCKENGIDKIRLHRNLGNISFVKRFVKKRYNNWLKKQGFITTDYFAYVMDIDGREIPDNTEIMVHPDYDKNGALIDRRGMENDYPIGNPMLDLSGDKTIVLRGFSQLS